MSATATVLAPDVEPAAPAVPGAPGAPSGQAGPEAADRARTERLGEEIARLSAHVTAATYRLLVLIRAFDEAEGWHHQGFRSCAEWLSWRTGVGPGAARERVRVARALAELPMLSGAVERGELSYSVARALTRVATPENEPALLEAARHGTAAEALYRSEDSAAEASDDDPDTPSPAARRADAMGLVAEAALGEGLAAEAEDAPVMGGADRFQAVVRVSAETLSRGGDESTSAERTVAAADEEPPHLEHGPHLWAETARRLVCDTSVVATVHDAEGRVLEVGRKRRTVPTALRRALAHRDRRCTFPGCGCRFCDAHHRTPWAEEGDGCAEPRFHRPDGRLLPRVPAPPAVPADPVGALERAHAERGLAIDHETATPRWDGVAMDIDWALGALRGDAWPEGGGVSAQT